MREKEKQAKEAQAYIKKFVEKCEKNKEVELEIQKKLLKEKAELEM